MRNYLNRVLDDELRQLIDGLPAVTIEGPRAVGKTETALRLAKTVHRLDDSAQLEILQAEPRRMLTGEPPILIDEWQRLPQSWDLVRRAVDQDPSPGRFVLTGSAAPIQPPTHSGAGRIVTVRMRPMSLAERQLGEASVSLAALLDGSQSSLEGTTSVQLQDYAAEIVRTGFPAVRRYSKRLLRAQIDGYLNLVTEHDFFEQGRSVRDRSALMRWLMAFAAASSTTASYTKIRDAATAGEEVKPAQSTTLAYRSTLERTWLIEEVPAWRPTGVRLRRLALSPVHQLADPGLAARLLGVGVGALVRGAEGRVSMPRDGILFGALFESLVTQSMRVYAQASEANVFHLRTRAGEHEVDLIVERDDGCVAAFEVKLSPLVSDRDVRHLHWLKGRLGTRLLDAAVITTGTEAYRRTDGIGVIPAALLTI